MLPPSGTRARACLLSFLFVVNVTEGFRVLPPRMTISSSNNIRVAPAAPTRDVAAALSAPTTIPNSEGHRVMSSWQFMLLDFLFSIPVVNAAMFGTYRKQMVVKAEKMGIRWTAFMDNMRSNQETLMQLQEQLVDAAVEIPQYYYAPIHAYADGNLCWDSAMEEDLWSKLMISPLFNNSVHGDILLRKDWLNTIQRHIAVDDVNSIVDLGCGTGLSMYMAQKTFPDADVMGVDLSTYKLAISKNKLLKMPKAVQRKVQLRHKPAESTGLPAGQADIVTICLVLHESPEWVSKAMMAEASRLLRPGGVLTIMDLDKNNLEILLENSFVAAVYKQTEPYMSEYLKLDISGSIAEAGFDVLEVRNSSPSHLSVVARKRG